MTIVTTWLCAIRESYQSSSFTTCIFTVTSLPQGGAISLLTSVYIDSSHYSRGEQPADRGGRR